MLLLIDLLYYLLTLETSCPRTPDTRCHTVPPRFCSVIKIILQFCKENSLVESFNAIQVRRFAAMEQ
jgi:hypothetical protein